MEEYYIDEKTVENIVNAFGKIANFISETIEKLSDVIEEIAEILKDNLKLKTSFRYKFVKYLSKLSGCSFHQVWIKTRYIHLARSNC